MVNKPSPRSRATAEKLAIEALSFIASDSERLGRFLAATGIGPADIRAAAREPLFLAGVLDHLANNETELVAFAKESGSRPEDVLLSRERLAGRNWERDTP
ncbi:MAG: DUF3572 domain-containing protein [Pseudorhodoplanes sp.]